MFLRYGGKTLQLRELEDVPIIEQEHGNNKYPNKKAANTMRVSGHSLCHALARTSSISYSTCGSSPKLLMRELVTQPE